MIMIKKKWFYATVATVCVIAATVLYLWPSKDIPTLKCKAFGKVNMDIEQGQLVFLLLKACNFTIKTKVLFSTKAM